MAETQNVFVTKTQNRFLPIIQAFNDNLYKHMQMQGELNDKMLAFNQKVGTEKFIGEYGKKIGTAKDISSLSKILSEGITIASSKGYNSAIPMMQSLAQVQQSFIGEEKINQQAKDAEAFYISQYGEQKFAWNGKETLGKDVIAQMKIQFTDPVTRYNAMTKLPEFAIKQVEGVTMRNGQAFVNSAGMDAFGNVYSNDTAPVFANKTGVYRDTDKSGNYTKEDKALTPGLLKEYSDLVESNSRFNRQMGMYSKPTFANMIDTQGHPLYSSTDGMFFYESTPDGKRKKVFVDTVDQFSKITTPKNTPAITTGQFKAVGNQVETLKNNALARLVDADLFDINDPANSVKFVDSEGGKTVNYANVPIVRLTDALNELQTKINNKEDLNEEEALAYNELLIWKAGMEQAGTYGQQFMMQNTRRPVTDFSIQNDSIKSGGFIMNATEFKKGKN